jgi:hypothetical protein
MIEWGVQRTPALSLTPDHTLPLPRAACDSSTTAMRAALRAAATGRPGELQQQLGEPMETST